MFKRVLKVVGGVVGGALLVLWGINSSLLAGPPDGARVRVLAHRGVHQQFSRQGLTRDSCTAEMALPADHMLLENTLGSMRAAFEAGADVVELDIHPTTDDQLAVFHDWTVDCRTNGSGPIRDFSMDALRQLDLGHGYTTDGGQTYPLRGSAVGRMPELSEVFEAFPHGRFLVNVKSDDLREIDLLHAMLADNPAWERQVWAVYGSTGPVDHARSLWPGGGSFSKSTLKACLLDYLAWGWTGRVPESCHGETVTIPINAAWLLWGWPHRFQHRMRSVDARVVLLGPMGPGDVGSTGIDTLAQLEDVPDHFDGWLWTNRVELIGPALWE